MASHEHCQSQGVAELEPSLLAPALALTFALIKLSFISAPLDQIKQWRATCIDMVLRGLENPILYIIGVSSHNTQIQSRAGAIIFPEADPNKKNCWLEVSLPFHLHCFKLHLGLIRTNSDILAILSSYKATKNEYRI